MMTEWLCPTQALDLWTGHREASVEEITAGVGALRDAVE
jgi:hypothetical protein